MTSTCPTISIIMPVLNEAATVKSMLQRLAPLRAQGVEVVVIDGGSTDETVSIARPLADHLLQAPRGRARQMNAGAHAAQGDILLFLHADTLLPDHALELITQGLTDTQTTWGRFDVRIEGKSPMLRVVATLMNLRSRLSGIATGDQAIFVQRAAFQDIGGFPDQPLMEDVELSRRLKRLSSPLCLRKRVTTSGRRWEKNGVWRTIRLMWRLRFLYWLGVSPERLEMEYR